ncbi:protein kinase superfamily protein [Actinidia rufa]|uniref:non-specific serine/threonine protein kinase n=1 Tax=Actinidia rufa TaxID=165716 RepID=A0A7J0F8R9_9ERIC|nr:protein kinase superfamily protein [Actinidia rufa]
MAVSGQNQTSEDYISHNLTSKTPFLGIKLYLVIGVCIACLITACLTIFLCVLSNRNSKRRRMRVKHSSGLLPLVSKQIIEAEESDLADKSKMEEYTREEKAIVNTELRKGIGTEIGGKKRSSESHVSGGSQSDTSSSATSTLDGMSIGWGRWYSLSELEMATRGFTDENVIGEGGYGVVYRAVLADGSVVAVKNLLNNKGQAEKEFKVEVEAIGKVRHKNLVGLLGYCAEGARRLLVYEYIDNGNLEQWLHGDVGPVSPLTWDIRIGIAVGTAKGYVSPEYASTGMLNEWSDVYSFGVLLMEIVTGRNPVDYSRPPGEMNLVDWFKGMVASKRGEEVVDPLIQVQPAPRALKRVLLVCLRCIDLDVKKRPKMGQIVHMLEADEFPFRVITNSLSPQSETNRKWVHLSNDAFQAIQHSPSLACPPCTWRGEQAELNLEPRTTKETAPLNSQAAATHIVPHTSSGLEDGGVQRSKWR